MIENEKFSNEFVSAIDAAKTIFDRDELLDEMFETMPADLLGGFISDELEAVEKQLRELEQTLSRLDPVKDKIGIEGINTTTEMLVKQKGRLLDKQKDLIQPSPE